MELQSLILDATWYIYIFLILIMLVTKFSQQEEGVWAIVGLMCLFTSFCSAIVTLNLIQTSLPSPEKNIYLQSTMFVGAVILGSLGSGFISNWLVKIPNK